MIRRRLGPSLRRALAALLLAAAFVGAPACGRDALTTPPPAPTTPPPAPPPAPAPACDPTACGDCGRPLVEECNGRDDDCDGLVDEGCPRRLLSSIATAYAVGQVRLVGDRALVLREGNLLLLDVPSGQITFEQRAIPWTRGVSLSIGPAALGDRFTAWVERVSDGNTGATSVVVRDHAHGAQIVTRVDSTIYQIDTRHEHVVFSDSSGAAVRLHGFDREGALDARVSNTTLPSLRLAGDWIVALVGDAHDQVVSRDLLTGEVRTLARASGGETMSSLLAAGDAVSWVTRYPSGGEARVEADVRTGTLAAALPMTAVTAFSDALVVRMLIPSSGAPRLEAIDRTTGRTRTLASDVTAADVDGRRVLYALSAGEVWLVDVEP